MLLLLPSIQHSASISSTSVTEKPCQQPDVHQKRLSASAGDQMGGVHDKFATNWDKSGLEVPSIINPTK